MSNAVKKLPYKVAMTLSAASIVNVKNEHIDLTGNRLVFVTACGIITGTVVRESDSDDNISILPFMKQIPLDAADISSDPCDSILLKDVSVVLSGGHQCHLDFLHLFCSEIIGISLAAEE